jgi:hypothetical protein
MKARAESSTAAADKAGARDLPILAGMRARPPKAGRRRVDEASGLVPGLV